MGEGLNLTKINVLKLSPVLTGYNPIKTYLSSIMPEKLEWDSLLPQDLVDIWTKLFEHLKRIAIIGVPRCVLFPTDETISIQLHGFSDSSKSPYCAAVYIRQETSTGIHVGDLTAKTKVVLLTEITIPRLELSSCF